MNRWRFHAKNLFWSITWKFKRFRTVEDLVEEHFNRWSESDHQNRKGLTLALSSLSRIPAVIVETGTSAYGTDSSRLFDAYVRSFGGSFYSVDINSYPSKRLKFAKSKRTQFYIMDSVQFLLNFTDITARTSADLIYLDSLDVDWGNSIESAEHGEKELLAIRQLLRPGTILVIDDTPSDMKWIPVSDHSAATNFKNEFGVLPGKGAFHNRALEGIDFKIIYHDYNLVIRVE